MGKVFLAILGSGLVIYAIACLGIWWGQTRLIFFPQPAPIATPAAIGLTYEDVWIPIGRDRLHGWWLPGRDRKGRTVLIFHGNASNVEDGLYHAEPFLKAGLSAFIIDYRGYGLSKGKFPSEAQVYEDAEVAWDYLTQVRRVKPADIILFGNSIGGAIAIDLAVRHPQAAGLIVQSSFTRMADMVDYLGYSRFFPKILLHQTFDSLKKVPQLTMPTLFIHGTADTTVPLAMGDRLYAAAPEPKYLWHIPGANHNNLAEVAGDRYATRLHWWLSTLPTCHPPTLDP